MATPVDPTPVLDSLDGFRRSKAMFAALELGVFERLRRSPARAEAVAAELGLHPDATERLLDTCVGLDLLAKKDGVYSNLPAATTYLVRSSPQALVGYIDYSNRVGYKLWGDLETGIRKGIHLWETTFGLKGNIFDHFFKTEDSKRDFLLGMHGMGLLSSPLVVRAFDLGRFRHLVDLGGATGHLTIAACERYPDLRGVVFELRAVAPAAREQVARSSARDRIEVVEGDFFADDLPDSDLFALGQVLHDWTEDKIARLLRRIYDRLPDGGGLLIAERLLDDDGAGPVPAVMQSLNMLVCTEGRERSPGEYERLLRAAGFREVGFRRTGTPRDAALARK